MNNNDSTNEHEEFIKLRIRYDILSDEIKYSEKAYNSLFDWLNENYPDILQDYLYKRNKENYNDRSIRTKTHQRC